MADSTTQEFTLEHLHEMIESGEMNIEDFISTVDVIARLRIYAVMAQAYAWDNVPMSDNQLTLLIAGATYDTEANEFIGLLAETGQLAPTDNLNLFHPVILDQAIQARGEESRVSGVVADSINDWLTGGWDWLVGGRGDFFYVPAGRELDEDFQLNVFGLTERPEGQPFIHRPEGGFTPIAGGPAMLLPGTAVKLGGPSGPLKSIVQAAGQKIPLFRAGSSSNTVIRNVFGRTAQQQQLRDSLRLISSQSAPGLREAMMSQIASLPAATRAAFGFFAAAGATGLATSSITEWVWGPQMDARAQAMIESGDKYAVPLVPDSPLTATAEAARGVEPIPGETLLEQFRERPPAQPSDVNIADPSVPPPPATLAAPANDDDPLLGVLPGDQIKTTRYLDDQGLPTGASGPPTTLTDTFSLTAGQPHELTGKQWYKTSDIRRILNDLNAWERSALYDDLVSAGFMVDSNGRAPFSPMQWVELEQGFGALLAVSNKEGENYVDMLPRLVALGEATDTSTPFMRDAYLPLDPVALNQEIDDVIERRLGRKANDWEKAILAKHRESLNREVYERQQQLAYDQHIAQGRLAEMDGPGIVEVETDVTGFDAAARFDEFFEDRYAGELESQERRNQVRNDQARLFNSFNRTMGGI